MAVANQHAVALQITVGVIVIRRDIAQAIVGVIAVAAIGVERIYAP